MNHLAKYSAWSKCSKILPIVMKILWVVAVYVFSPFKISTQFFSGDHLPMPSRSPGFIHRTPLTTAAYTGRAGVLRVSVLGHSPPPGQWGAGSPAARGTEEGLKEKGGAGGQGQYGGAENTLSLNQGSSESSPASALGLQLYNQYPLDLSQIKLTSVS